MDIAQFRLDFPEFSDSVRYPDSQITFYSTIAETMTNADKWKTLWLQGVELYVAHEITLAAQSSQAGQNGSVPGQQGGPINSKAVGSVNVGYDTVTGSEKNAGWWNLTSYGKQYFRLSRMIGVGAVQL